MKFARDAVIVMSIMLFFVEPALSTTLIAMLDRKNNRIILAADSRTIHFARKPTKECKIRIVKKKNCAFGVAGDAEMRTDQGLISMYDMATTACKSSGDLRRKADAFLEIARNKVAIMVSLIRAKEPARFAELTKSQQPFISVFFAGTNQGQLDVLLRGFGVKTDGQIPETSESIGKDDALFAGVTEEIGPHLHERKWSEMGFENVAREFVEIEIQAQPKKVGGPVAILEIDRFGETRWINAGVCSKTE